ncbi:MAG: chorismate lyase [Mariprofundaceae bacterium]
MFFGDLGAQAWVPARQWNAAETGLGRDVAAVLTITGSLTRHLERRHGMRLEVRLHDQFVDVAEADEAALLECAAGAQALRRRVSLLHRGAVMFDAESVLPLAGLPADLVAELQAGRKPLANLLIDRGLSLSRSDLGIARLHGTDAHDGRWARRSVLRSASGTRALVVEVFQDALWRTIEAAGRRY